MTRSQKVAEARALKAQGVSLKEIAERFGVHHTTIFRWTHDVLVIKSCAGCGADLTGSHGRTKWCSDRCRKDTLYAGKCIDCGAVTDGVKSGAHRPVERCQDCTRTRNAERNELLLEMWEADEPTYYIAEKLGMTETAVTTWINWQRRHGKQIILRKLSGDAQERAARHRELLRLRERGLTNAEIAEELGYSSAASVVVALDHLRRKGWSVPLRCKPVASLEEIVRLRKAGLTFQEIADELGYASASGPQARLRDARRRGLVPA